MQKILQAVNFFLFSSLYISLCAVLMVYQTYQLLFHSATSIQLSLFVFFSTICSYNFHWYFTAVSATSSIQAKWSQQHKALHLILYLVGLSGAAIYFFILREHWMALAFAGIVTFLYSAPKLPQTFFKELKKIAIGKTIFLAFVWMYVTTILPVYISGRPFQTAYILFACSRFFLIYPICIIFDLRDREDDKKEGIRSMITYLSESGVNNVFVISLLLFAASTISMYWFGFSFIKIFVLLLPGIITAALYDYSKRNFSDYLYCFVLDGMMMFSGLLMLVFKI